MSFARAIFIVFVLLGTSVGQQPQTNTPNDNPQAKWTDRTNLGYHGPLHCALITTKKLAADPRDARYAKANIDPGTSWMCFDTTGWMIENGYEENGHPAGVIKIRRGAEGEWLGSTEQREGITVEHKQEKKTERVGDVETTDNYLDGRLILRGKTWYDSQNRPIREESYSFPSGDTNHDKASVNVTTISYDGTATTTDQQLFNGKTFQRHERCIVDETSGRQDAMLFDASGRLIQEMRLGKDGVEYAWHDPDLKTSDPLASGGWNEEFKRTVYTSFSPEGEVLKEVQHHPGRYGNVEPDDAEITDSRGVIVERVEFKYERDAHDNWVNRTVLIRDPKTGSTIEVARNHRELSYY